MKVSLNKLPKPLKKILNEYRKDEGISAKEMIEKVEKKGQVVLKVNYPFPHNWVMYRGALNAFNDKGELISDEEWRDKLEKMFSEKTSEYDQLIEQIGIFLFSKNWNNNIDQFFNILENDDGEGKWEIIIENPRIIEHPEIGGDWLNVDVYLVPIGFEID